jgi:hypothetical protein
MKLQVFCYRNTHRGDDVKKNHREMKAIYKPRKEPGSGPSLETPPKEPTLPTL